MSTDAVSAGCVDTMYSHQADDLYTPACKPAQILLVNLARLHVMSPPYNALDKCQAKEAQTHMRACRHMRSLTEGRVSHVAGNDTWRTADQVQAVHLLARQGGQLRVAAAEIGHGQFFALAEQVPRRHFHRLHRPLCRLLLEALQHSTAARLNQELTPMQAQ